METRHTTAQEVIMNEQGIDLISEMKETRRELKKFLYCISMPIGNSTSNELDIIVKKKANEK